MPNQILNEAQVLDETRLTKNKLLSMKDHLEALLRKKIRLDSEIVVLRKAIKNKEKHFALKIKTGVQLESCRPFVVIEESSGDYQIGIPEELPTEIQHELLELVQVTNEIKDLYQSYQEEFERP